MTGELIKHGPASENRDPYGKSSYFVQLKLPGGGVIEDWGRMDVRGVEIGRRQGRVGAACRTHGSPRPAQPVPPAPRRPTGGNAATGYQAAMAVMAAIRLLKVGDWRQVASARR